MKKFELLGILLLVIFLALNFSFRSWENLFRKGPLKRQDIPVLTTGQPEGCLFCHEERIQEKAHAVEVVGCSGCHLGNPLTVDFRASHQGVVKNPGDLRVVARTCGNPNCHPNDVMKVKYSLMATNHGIITRLLEVFGEKDLLQRHPNLKVEDLGQKSFQSYALDYFKKLCGSCHLYLEKGRLPDFLSEKGGGCTACHGIGRKEDLKDKKLHPQLTAKIPLEKCVKCHNRSGRIGLTYQGLYEDEQSGSADLYLPDGRKLKRIEPDVHYKAGLLCIDCHTKNEVMGNGTFYRRIEEALEVDCETCHVRKGETKKGTRLANLLQKEGKLFLKGKGTNKLHLLNSPLPACQERYHQRLSCTSCHAQYVPQCYGCHVRYDPREKHLDKILGKETLGLWEEHESYRRIDKPPLAVRKDKVVVITPG